MMVMLHCIASELERNDERISRFFSAIDESLGVNIGFVLRGSKWMPMADRVRHVDEWIPTTKGNRLPDVFGNGTHGKTQVVVSIMNILHGGDRASPRASEYRVTVGDRSGFLESFPKALERIAIAVGAAYGTADSAACAEQIMRTPEDVAQNPEIADIPGFRIYPLRRARVFSLDASGAPVQMRLSWLNYWSDAVARALGFPDPVRDRPLEGLYERIADRGWLVALTQAPLDLERPEHLAQMQWAFDRFGQH